MLDEIGDLPPGGQAKLLRLLENKTFRRVGGVQELRSRRARHRGDQRRPRGAGLGGPLPRRPLLPAQRGPDRGAAAARAPRGRPHPDRPLHRPVQPGDEAAACGASRPAAMELLKALPLARERPRAAERHRARVHPARGRRGDPPRAPHARSCGRRSPAKRPDRLVPPVTEQGLVLDDVERKLIAEAMERASGNQSKAARLLGVSRDTLRYRLKKHGMWRARRIGPGARRPGGAAPRAAELRRAGKLVRRARASSTSTGTPSVGQSMLAASALQLLLQLLLGADLELAGALAGEAEVLARAPSASSGARSSRAAR